MASLLLRARSRAARGRIAGRLRLAPGRRTLHEAGKDETREHRTTEKRDRLPAGKVLDAAHELVEVLALERARDALEAVGRLLDAAGAQALIAPAQIIGRGPQRAGKAMHPLGGRILLLIGGGARPRFGILGQIAGVLLQLFGRRLGLAAHALRGGAGAARRFGGSG